jgi:hypothetical protein
MLGEPIYKKVLHADDVGTRLEHMMQLQDLWSTSYGILTRDNFYHTGWEYNRAAALGIALDLLQHHMEAEYNLTQYAKEINDLPKPTTKQDPPPDDIVTFRDTI